MKILAYAPKKGRDPGWTVFGKMANWGIFLDHIPKHREIGDDAKTTA